MSLATSLFLKDQSILCMPCSKDGNVIESVQETYSCIADVETFAVAVEDRAASISLLAFVIAGGF